MEFGRCRRKNFATFRGHANLKKKIQVVVLNYRNQVPANQVNYRNWKV